MCCELKLKNVSQVVFNVLLLIYINFILIKHINECGQNIRNTSLCEVKLN